MEEDITIELIKPSEKSINFIFGIFTDSFYTKSFPTYERTYSCIYSMVRNWEEGNTFFWIAFYDEKPISVFHGKSLNIYQFEIHQLVLKDYWGKKNWPIQNKCSIAMGDDIFNGLPKIKQITGFTPMNHTHAIRFAERAKFVKVGELPDYFEYDNKLVNAAIMVRTRRAE